jgi:hypothetical protein
VRRCREFLLADLPVDRIVVLEQEERAGQRERIPGALRELRCPR